MATDTLKLFCDPCKDSREEQIPVAFCLECRELYCVDCLDCHRNQKASSSHSHVQFSKNGLEKAFPCESCKKQELANFLCTVCRELYCTTCSNRHRKFKVSKNHTVLEFTSSQPTPEITEITSDLSVCSLKVDATHSSAQVPIVKGDKENKEDTSTSDGKFPDEDEQYYTVELPKGPKGFGFTINGGREYKMPLFVQRIAQGGSADIDGRLRVWDQILEVNNFKTENETRSDIADVIKCGGATLRVYVKRTGKIPPNLVVGNPDAGRYPSDRMPIPPYRRDRDQYTHF